MVSLRMKAETYTKPHRLPKLANERFLHLRARQWSLKPHRSCYKPHESQENTHLKQNTSIFVHNPSYFFSSQTNTDFLTIALPVTPVPLLYVQGALIWELGQPQFSLGVFARRFHGLYVFSRLASCLRLSALLAHGKVQNMDPRSMDPLRGPGPWTGSIKIWTGSKYVPGPWTGSMDPHFSYP